MSKENEEIIVDDFLEIPNADSVLSGGTERKNSIFDAPREADLSFLDEEEEKTEEETEEKETDSPVKEKKIDSRTIDEINADKEEAFSLFDEAEEEGAGTSENTIEKGSVADMFTSLIKDEFITPFDDDKELSEYTVDDFKELLKANVEEKIANAKEETPKQFFDMLPEELKYAASHFAKGNKDMKSVFRALAEREDVKELDADNEKHVEAIARQYLQASGYGSGDDAIIEDQIQDWIETGDIGKKAKLFKPKLDQMQEKILESKLKKQEEFQETQVAKRKTYVDDVYKVLEKGELNGMKINNKMQNHLFNELTTTKYQSMSGKPTNLLGKLLEDHQFGEKPRMDLIAEATWLLSNPEEYKEQMIKKAVSDTNLKTAKTLKTEEGRKLKSTTAKEKEPEKVTKTKKTIKRVQRNIFER